MRKIQGGANKGWKTVVFGEVVAGYDTPANGWASEIMPLPGEVAILIRNGDEYTFSTWLLGTAAEIQNRSEFGALSPSEKARVIDSLDPSFIEASQIRFQRSVEECRQRLVQAESYMKSGVFGALGLVRDARGALSRSEARLTRITATIAA
jgi:hypothetical protein